MHYHKEREKDTLYLYVGGGKCVVLVFPAGSIKCSPHENKTTTIRTSAKQTSDSSRETITIQHADTLYKQQALSVHGEYINSRCYALVEMQLYHVPSSSKVKNSEEK